MINYFLKDLKFLRSSMNTLLSKRDEAWYRHRKFDQQLLVASFILLLIAGVLSSFGGYHAGFFSLQALTTELLPSAAWANITFIGDTLVALTIALFFSYRYPKIVLAILIAAIVGTIMIQGMKHAFDMGRPLTVYGQDMLHLIGPGYRKNAFPSGHTATAFTLAGILYRCTDSRTSRYGILATAILVGISRVACGVHWPIDVVVGAALGLFSAWIGIRLSDYLKLGLNTYTALSTLLVASAYMLISYDGGFETTAYFAQVLGVAALAYWLLCWAMTLVSFNTRIARRLGWVSSR